MSKLWWVFWGLISLAGAQTFAQSAPDWFINRAHVSADRKYIYGFGAGINQTKAHQAGLADIGQFFSSEVQSTSQSRDVMKKGSDVATTTRSSFEQDVAIKSQMVNLQGAEDDAVAKQDLTVYVRVRVAVDNLTNTWKTSVNSFTQAARALGSDGGKKIDNLAKAIQLYPKFRRAQSNLALLHTLENLEIIPKDGSVEALDEPVQQAAEQMTTIAKAGVYSIANETPKTAVASATVARLLAMDQVRTQRSAGGDGTFLLSSSGTESDVMGAKKVKGNLTVQLTGGGTVYCSQNFPIEALSPNSYDDAWQKAVQNWGQSQNGLLAALAGPQ